MRDGSRIWGQMSRYDFGHGDEDERSANNYRFQKYPCLQEPAIKSFLIQGMSSIQKNNRRNSGRLKAAPKSQYIMYLNNADNVFYENRREAKLLHLIHSLQPLIKYTFFALLLAYFILSFVGPHEGPCPANANCGMFIHCHSGYQQQGENCVISQETREHVDILCSSVIKNLQYEYGDQQCSSSPVLRPAKHIDEMMSQFQIEEGSAVHRQMNNWLTDKKLQKKYNFQLIQSEIIPLQKNYSLFCRFQLVVNSQKFMMYFGLALLLFALLLWYYRISAQNKRAKAIYNAIKAKMAKRNGEYTFVVKNMSKEFGKISAGLWEKIDLQRVADGKIVYYEDSRLHWRFL